MSTITAPRTTSMAWTRVAVAGGRATRSSSSVLTTAVPDAALLPHGRQRIREHGGGVVLDLEEAAVDLPALLGAARAAHGERAARERGDERGMVREHAEVTLGAGRLHVLHLAFEHRALGRQDAELEERG